MRILTRLTLSLIGAGLLVFLLCPEPPELLHAPYSTRISDADGRTLRLSLAADEHYRLPVRIKSVPEHVKQAILQYEDQYFYQHPGVNPMSLLRGAYIRFFTKQRQLGGSTISMQLARMRYGLNTRTLTGKARQILLALQIERHHSKSEILEAYLTLAPYGGNVAGISAAARIYFDKDLTELNLAEALALSVIPQNPVKRHPHRRSAEARAARIRLAKRWQSDDASLTELTALASAPLNVRADITQTFDAPHLSSYLISTRAPGDWRSTIDRTLQYRLTQAVRSYTAANRFRGINNASALLIDNRSMNVVASIGSAGFHKPEIAGQVDGTRAPRSPGSTLKPFVYALAMDAGLIHPYSLMDDTAKRFAAFTPENFDRRFAGPIVAQDALIYSRNVPAVDLLNRLGQQRFHQFLTDAGVAGLRPASFYGLASVLGGNELSMVEIAQLYAMLANGGRWQAARFTVKDQARSARRLLSPEASFLTLHMLAKNPPAPGFQHPGQRQFEIAWKTGTSFAFRDAWAVGVVGPYTLAVWTGNFDGSSNNAFVGRTASGPLFFSIIESLADRLKNTRHSLSRPPATLSLALASMCVDSGDLAGAHCPRATDGYLIPGVSPIKVSKIYRRIPIDSKTGLRTCRSVPDSVEFRTYAFWPSKAAAAMRSAGIHLKQAPAWNPSCSLEQRAAADRAPKISTPLANSIYHSRKNDPSRNTIELQADVASDVESVYWFANKVPLGRSTRDGGLLWQLEPGTYQLTAIDDAGRTDQTQLRVN